MLRTTLIATFTTLSTSAFAHGTHITNVAGHNHLSTMTAIAIIAIAVIGTGIAVKKHLFS